MNKTRIIRIVCFALLALIFALVGGQTGAQAAEGDPDGIPPSSLPGCSAPQDAGGWLVRSHQSHFTFSAAETREVRPRSMTLGEPCVDDGALGFTAQLTEIPMTEPEGGWPDDPTPGETTYGTICDDDGCVTFVDVFAVGVPPFTRQVFCGVGSSGSYGAGATELGNPIQFQTTPGTNRNADGSGAAGSGSDGVGYDGLYWNSVCAATGDYDYWVALGTYGNPLTDPADVVCIRFTGFDCAVPTDVPLGTIHNTAASYMEVGGHWASQENKAVCSTSRVGGTTFELEADTITIFDGVNPVELNTMPRPDSLTVTAQVRPGWTAADCPYLRVIYMSICTMQTANGPDNIACFENQWLYSNYRQHIDYPDAGGDGPQDWLCTNLPADALPGADCDPIIYPPFIDNTDFDSVCGGAPEFTWGDFAWLPDFVGHYVNCLFVPTDDLSKNLQLQTALDAAGFTAVGDAVSEFLDSMTYGSTCGVIVDASAIEYMPMSITTCDWTWAEPLRGVIGAGMVIGFFIWLLTFITAMFGGVANKKTPNIMSTKED